MFLAELGQDPVYFFTVVGVVVFSTCLHEVSHALAALSQGDDTAAKAGHLSMNPMVHMGGTSLLMLALVGIAWGQTPVNPSRFRHSYSGAVVSFAGPLANLILMVLAVALIQVVPPAPFLAPFLKVAAVFNAVLFLLNMLPIPPLDGFGILESLVPSLKRVSDALSGYGFLILFMLFVMFNLGSWLFLLAQQMVWITSSMLPEGIGGSGI